MARAHGCRRRTYSPRTIYIAMKGGHALRHGDWKLIVPSKGSPQLFNIATDPYEKAGRRDISP